MAAPRANRVLVAAVLLWIAPAPVKAVTIGVAGDSFSDEYTALSGGPFLGYEGFSWVEILAMTGRAEFGTFDPTPGALGLPAGYPTNFALKGAAATDVNTGDVSGFVPGLNDIGQKFSEQIAGLAALISGPVPVDAAVVAIGANDIFARTGTLESFDPADPGYMAFQMAVASSIAAGLDTLQSAGSTPVVLAQIPDLTASLLALQPIFGWTDEYTAQATAASFAINPLLEAEAIAREIPFFDLFSEVEANLSLFSSLFGNPFDLVPLGDPAGIADQCGFNNVTFEMGCPTIAYQKAFINDDAVHPTTQAQGLAANSIISVLNGPGIELGLTPIPIAEIRSIAGIPEPATALLVGIGLLGMAWSRRAV